MYSQSITHVRPTAFVLLIDASGSMNEPIEFRGKQRSKAQAVTTICNELLFELIERAHRNHTIRNYYDVAILAYGGADTVRPLLSPRIEWIPITEIARFKPSHQVEQIEFRLPNGKSVLRSIASPRWIQFEAQGQTPMCEALRTARDLLQEWCLDPLHANSFPPIVFNITDGEATDADEEELRDVTQQIKRLNVPDGNVLLIHIHITSLPNKEAKIFPSPKEIPLEVRHARLLYTCSSVMPDLFTPAIRNIKGLEYLPPFRGMGYNASPNHLITLLNIGSVSVKTE